MEPKYYAFRRRLDIKIILWQYDWIPTVDGSEIPNNHLGYIKHCKQWDKLPSSTGEHWISESSTDSTVWLDSYKFIVSYGNWWYPLKRDIPKKYPHDIRCIWYGSLIITAPPPSQEIIAAPLHLLPQLSNPNKTELVVAKHPFKKKCASQSWIISPG